MIFVTVGTTHLPFDRLIKSVDRLSFQYEDRIIIQIGHSTYEPKYASWFRFKSKEEMDKLINDSKLVITHGGFGIISECLLAYKKVIACPRMLEFGEAVNPQVELVSYLAERNLLIALKDTNQLMNAIQLALAVEFNKWSFESKVPNIIANYLQESLNFSL